MATYEPFAHFRTSIWSVRYVRYGRSHAPQRIYLLVSYFLNNENCHFFLLLRYKLPPHELVIRLEDSELKFQCGSCFFIVFYSGLFTKKKKNIFELIKKNPISAIICIVSGMVIAIIDCIFPHKFSTVLEVDYDTPYDRHIIIEDSHETRDKKKKIKLEEPPQTSRGSKLLRYLKFNKKSEIFSVFFQTTFET